MVCDAGGLGLVPAASVPTPVAPSLLELPFVALQLGHEPGVRVDHVASRPHFLVEEREDTTDANRFWNLAEG